MPSTKVRQAPTTAWDRLFAKPRHRLRYPDEHVVRFLASLDPGDGDALDAGCGTGRHTLLLSDLGWRTYAVDSSSTAAKLTRMLVPRAFSVQVADLAALPFTTGSFTVVVANASLYYGDRASTVAKVAEVRRVLRPGGRAFISLRTTRDSRLAHTHPVSGELRRPNDERGMVCDFVGEQDVRSLTRRFVSCETTRVEAVRMSDGWRDSDWVLTLAR